MTHKQLVRKINEAICGIAPGIFHDEHWVGFQKVHNALLALSGVEVHLEFVFYDHDERRNPCRKTWGFTVFDGKNTASVTVVAAGAGSVDVPLSCYDIVAYAI